MKPINKSYLIILVFAFILVVFLISLFIGKIDFGKNKIPVEEGYHRQILEGEITYINLDADPPIIKIKAEAFRIIEGAGLLEKTLEVRPDLEDELILYNMTTNKQERLDLKTLKVGDFINVGTRESTFEELLERDVFTAVNITKFYESE